jgi:hypothetical protein
MGNMSIGSNSTNGSVTDAFANLTKANSSASATPVSIPTPVVAPSPVATASAVVTPAPVAAPVENVTAPLVDEAAQGIFAKVFDMVAFQSVGDVVAKNIIAPLAGDSYTSQVSVGVSTVVVGALAYADYKEVPKAVDAFQRRNWKQFVIHGGAAALASVRIVHEFWYGGHNLPLPKIRLEF